MNTSKTKRISRTRKRKEKKHESNCKLFSTVSDTSTNYTNSSKPNSNSNSKSDGNDFDACDNELPESVNPETLKDFLNELKESFACSNRSTNRAGDYDDNWQKSNICVICDCLIIGTEEIKLLNKEHIENSADRLSVSSYEEYYCIYLKRELVQQYQVEDPDLHGLLLSPRAGYYKEKHEYQC
jgi:hypothetical protein